MRLVSFIHLGQTHIGLQTGQQIVDLNRLHPQLPTDMAAFLALGESALELAHAVGTQQCCAPAIPESCLLAESSVTLLAPIPRPGKILCIGHNYQGHIGIGKTEIPEYPNFFCKTANVITGPNQPIFIPRVTAQVDYEAELAVIIGKRGRDIPESEALGYVAGYSIFNDVSARDYQKRTSQWFLGKSFDSFGPLGPALVTKDEVPNPHNLALELTVNGIPKQRTHTSQLIFSIPFLVSYLSQVLTLEPGDIIATGTPSKLPEAATPQRFLVSGDVVEITIETLGNLTSPIQ